MPDEQKDESAEEKRWTAADEEGFQQLSKAVKELEARRNGHVSRMQHNIASLLNRDGFGRRAIDANAVINFIIANRQELIEALGGAFL